MRALNSCSYRLARLWLPALKRARPSRLLLLKLRGRLRQRRCGSRRVSEGKPAEGDRVSRMRCTRPGRRWGYPQGHGPNRRLQSRSDTVSRSRPALFYRSYVLICLDLLTFIERLLKAISIKRICFNIVRVFLKPNGSVYQLQELLPCSRSKDVKETHSLMTIKEPNLGAAPFSRSTAFISELTYDAGLVGQSAGCDHFKEHVRRCLETSTLTPARVPSAVSSSLTDSNPISGVFFRSSWKERKLGGNLSGFASQALTSSSKACSFHM